MADMDRTVHARNGELEIVRYDRAGKWYAEYNPPRLRSRLHLTIKSAALLAVECDEVFLRKPGGGAFDRAYQRHAAEQAALAARGAQGGHES